jgi:adenylate cyclase class 2
MPTLIEIKAKCAKPDYIRTLLLKNKAVFKGIDHQIDTYFKVANGRLKLREGNIENHLIHYHRPNMAGPKKSEVTLFRSTPGSTLKSLLTHALGTLVVVDKKREIYFIDNVKFHIDQVDQLGSFMEIEAIDEDGSISQETLQEQCEFYMSLLGISSKELVTNSYSDLLLTKND